MTKRHEPELPEPELHSPEKLDLGPGVTEEAFVEREKDRAFERAGCGCDDKTTDPACTRHNPAPVEQASGPSSYFPHGNEFAKFTLSGDCKVTIYTPAPGIRTIAVEVITGSEPFVEGAPDTRRQTTLQLPKAKARALASAIMGAAAEL